MRRTPKKSPGPEKIASFIALNYFQVFPSPKLPCRVLKGPGVFKGRGYSNWGTLRIPAGKIGEP